MEEHNLSALLPWLGRLICTVTYVTNFAWHFTASTPWGAIFITETHLNLPILHQYLSSYYAFDVFFVKGTQKLQKYFKKASMLHYFSSNVSKPMTSCELLRFPPLPYTAGRVVEPCGRMGGCLTTSYILSPTRLFKVSAQTRPTLRLISTCR